MLTYAFFADDIGFSSRLLNSISCLERFGMVAASGAATVVAICTGRGGGGGGVGGGSGFWTGGVITALV